MSGFKKRLHVDQGELTVDDVSAVGERIDETLQVKK
jgi:hypothetical protein